jgi:hypothetical protein
VTKEAENSVLGLAAQAGFDTGNIHIAHALGALLAQMKDKGTSIDSGGSQDSADLWVTVGGVEYYINIRKSNAQLEEEAQTP